jgi:hypothetical protein
LFHECSTFLRTQRLAGFCRDSLMDGFFDENIIGT